MSFSLMKKITKSRLVSGTRSTRGFALFGAAIFSLASVGCGNTLYLVQVTHAEKSFEEARELGAEEHSPYEYYAAEARLKEVQEEVEALRDDMEEIEGNLTDATTEAKATTEAFEHVRNSITKGEYAKEEAIPMETSDHGKPVVPVPMEADEEEREILKRQAEAEAELKEYRTQKKQKLSAELQQAKEEAEAAARGAAAAADGEADTGPTSG